MEVLQSASDKRTILVTLKEGNLSDELRCNLARLYNLVTCADANEALAVLDERFNALSAAIIDADIAIANDYAFLHAMVDERCFDTIPIIITTEREPDPACIRCVYEGAVDVIELPCPEQLLDRRIDNAIQLKRSSTFYEIESMLHVLPSMVFLKDADGRYVFSTQYWHHLDTGNDPKWTIRGKTDIDIRKDKANALLAMEADKKIIESGKGTSYVIEINTDGVQEFIQLIKEPVFDDDGNVTGIIALGNDVTESEKMRRELERYALIDELTGVGNRHAYSKFVSELKTRVDFPIAVISADCDNLKKVNDTLGHLVGDEYIHMAAIVLRAGLPEGSEVFRVGGDEFIAFAPHMTAEEAKERVQGMRHQAGYFKLHTGEAIVSYGVACLESASDLIEAIEPADQRMYADKASHKRQH